MATLDIAPEQITLTYLIERVLALQNLVDQLADQVEAHEAALRQRALLLDKGGEVTQTGK